MVLESASTASMVRPESGLNLLLKYLFENKIKFTPVGSSMIEGVKYPSDRDILIDGNMELSKWMDSHYDRGGSDLDITGREFVSYRMGQYNFIVSLNRDHYKKFVGAQALCEEKNIVCKQLRIEVFAYLFDDEVKPTTDRFAAIVSGEITKSDTIEF